MPYYDYRCLGCQRRVTLFYKTYRDYDAATEAAEHTCPRCGSQQLTRRIGRVAVAKQAGGSRTAENSEDDFMEGLAGVDENDPRSLGRYMRQMGNEMEEDLGDEFHEVVDRLEKGQSPEEIEQALPGLADGGDLGEA